MTSRPRFLKVALVTSLVAGGLVAGEATASPVDAAARAVPPPVHGCNYYEFCTYKNSNFTVMVDRMSSCVLHHSHGVFRSYVNHQTPGTRARFYDHEVKFLSKTYPAFHKGTTSLGGNGPDGAYYILPC
jgi:hypothetical protein